MPTIDEGPGFIDTNAVYTLGDFQARMRLKKAAMRELRRMGLRVCRVGRTAFIRGSDWDRFLQESEAKENAST